VPDLTPGVGNQPQTGPPEPDVRAGERGYRVGGGPYLCDVLPRDVVRKVNVNMTGDIHVYLRGGS
jgi:hypothetical protein